MDNAIAASCPACRANVAPGAQFCEQCGVRVPGPSVPQTTPAKPVVRRSLLRRSQQRSVDSETSAIGKARMCLSVIAGLLVLGTLIGWMGMESELSKARDRGMGINSGMVAQMRALLVANVVLAVAFVGLAVWAGRNAFAAVLTGLVLYIAAILASAAVSPITLVQGIIIKVIIIGLLIGGIRAGLQQRRRRRAVAQAHG